MKLFHPYEVLAMPDRQLFGELLVHATEARTPNFSEIITLGLRVSINWLDFSRTDRSSVCLRLNWQRTLAQNQNRHVPLANARVPIGPITNSVAPCERILRRQHLLGLTMRMTAISAAMGIGLTQGHQKQSGSTERVRPQRWTGRSRRGRPWRQ